MKGGLEGAFEEVKGKFIHAITNGIGKAVSGLYDETGKRLHAAVDHHLKDDKKIGADFDKLELHRPVGETPIYHIRDDGSIRRLRYNPKAEKPEDVYTHEKLTKEDEVRLGLRPEHRGRPREKERLARLKNDKEGRSRPRPTTTSREVPLGSTELARATQIARHKDSSYGSYQDGKFRSNNYAAARVTSADGKGDFILVGRSSGRRHSERMIGTPFLRQGDESRIQELYSEREPCGVPSNCSAWMAERLPHVDVSYSVEYGDAPSRLRGNDVMEKYLGLLRQSR